MRPDLFEAIKFRMEQQGFNHIFHKANMTTTILKRKLYFYFSPAT